MPDERRLGGRVGLAVRAMLSCEGQFEGLVLRAKLGAGTQGVSELELVAPALAANGDKMQVVGSVLRVGLAEPVHLVGQIRMMDIAQASGNLDCRSGDVERLDRRHDVDDRLGGKAGDCGATDVFWYALQPGGETVQQQIPLLNKQSCPTGRVLDKFNWLVGHWESRR